MILSEARTRLRRMVDDADSERFETDGELDDALGTGQEQAWDTAVASNRDLFTQEASVSSTAAGVVDLTTLKPLMPLANVAVSSGSMRLKVAPARLDDGPQNASGITTLLIAYVKRVTFPAAAGDAFVWGHANITATRVLDQLALAFAASDLLIKEGTENPVLERRKAELVDTVSKLLSGSGWSAIPLDELADGGAPESGLGYVMTAPDTMQLVNRRW